MVWEEANCTRPVIPLANMRGEISNRSRQLSIGQRMIDNMSSLMALWRCSGGVFAPGQLQTSARVKSCLACSSRFARAAAACELSGPFAPLLHCVYLLSIEISRLSVHHRGRRWRPLWRFRKHNAFSCPLHPATKQHHFLQAFLFPQLSVSLSSILGSFTLEQFLR